MKWGQEHKDEVARLWARGLRPSSMARVLTQRWGRRVTPNMIVGQSRQLNLHSDGTPMTLAKGHAAVVNGTTIFQKQVKPPDDSLLKWGASNRKLGGKVTKGRWKGMPIYYLTLEERATCPRSCLRWLDCYGNHMHNAVRYEHGEELEKALEYEIGVLADSHPDGFVVRLHVLGDFYSIGYVLKWADWITKYPPLHVFGYTAWQPDTPIGAMIEGIRELVWNRFAVRTSGAKAGPRAVTVASGKGLPQGELALVEQESHIVCPAQTRQTASCGTCTLCWSAPTKVIAFIRH